MYSNSRNSKLKGAIGETTFIEVIFEVIRMFEHETQEDSSGNKKKICNKDMDLKFDSCIFDSVSEIMMEELGCTVPFLPNVTIVCVKDSDKKIVEGYYENLAQGTQAKLCDNPCSTLITLFGIPFMVSHFFWLIQNVFTFSPPFLAPPLLMKFHNNESHGHKTNY